ncbi:general secretion pathway protein G [Desulfuromusa kysingii]|uniref:Type II secretion system core protein G n=1 Tax=Desulfuromusa kysingii TaxID=37625 RepID=A0A1H4CRH0_9BACT|nr:type II secretion system major pseudopilin GspG [Desulfuromusa kysingii]SEA62961.1 general secretion pathway protein G [Desulfuromusa kysingii]
MKKRCRNNQGFTLIEIMVVVVILGILASIVVPKLLDRPDQARVTKAQLDIKGLEESLGMFKLDNGFYPTTDQGLSALVTIPDSGRIPSKYPEGGYLKKIPKDPWEGDYLYLSPGAHSKDYDLISYGADGEPGGEGIDADINSWEL